MSPCERGRLPAGRLRPPALGVLLLILCGLAAPPALAQGLDSLAVPAVADSAENESRPGRLERMPVVGEVILVGRSGAHVLTAPLRWRADDLRTLGLAVGGVAALSLLDERGRDLMERSQSAAGDRLEDLVEPLGRERGLQLLGGFFVAGLVLDDPRMRAVAAEGVASGLVAAALIQPALAEVTGRPRPRKNRPAYTFEPFSGNISFPSGHTTAAFSVASVIATEYDHLAVRVAAYGLASAVGVARMYRGAHFGSDVAAAALLGTAVGRSVARFGRDYRARIRLEPVVHGSQTLLVLRLAI